MTVYDVIIRPILSEKSFSGVGKKNYTFEVARNATKPQIKKAVETAFKGVKVERVNTARMPGKPKRQGRTEGYTAEWKKAYVQLSKDSKSIEFFDGLQ